MQSIKAKISSGYVLRLAVIGGVCLFWAGWSIKDGAITYPQERAIALEYVSFQADGRHDQWAEHAAAQGWPTDPPGRPRAMWEIYFQYAMAGVTLPIGLVFGWSFLRSVGRSITMDEQQFVTSWGDRVYHQSITSLNLDRWEDKGIAVVHYRHDDLEATLMLDNWKFERSAITVMVQYVQALLAQRQAASQPADATAAGPGSESA